MKYLLKREVVFKPEFELPEGCQVVSVAHNPTEEGRVAYISESWEVTYIEPILKTEFPND